MEAVMFAKTGFPGADELGDAENDTDNDQQRHSWKLDRTIPPAFLLSAAGALMIGVWFLFSLSSVQKQHTDELTEIRATLQVVSNAISKIDLLSAQTAQNTSSLALMAATNQRITTLENQVSGLENASNRYQQEFGDISVKLARIETLMDSIKASSGVPNRSDRR